MFPNGGKCCCCSSPFTVPTLDQSFSRARQNTTDRPAHLDLEWTIRAETKLKKKKLFLQLALMLRRASPRCCQWNPSLKQDNKFCRRFMRSLRSFCKRKCANRWGVMDHLVTDWRILRFKRRSYIGKLHFICASVLFSFCFSRGTLPVLPPINQPDPDPAAIAESDGVAWWII